jgi:hypothetical protein
MEMSNGDVKWRVYAFGHTNETPTFTVGALNVAYYFETINLPFTKGTAFRVSIMPPLGGI